MTTLPSYSNVATNVNNNNNNNHKKCYNNNFIGLNEILFTCCTKGIPNCNSLIEFAIQHGANINEENYHYGDCNSIYGYTPLMIACYYGYEHIVNMLLHNTTNFNNTVNCNLRSSKNGCTALMVAIQQGHKHIVQLLLNYNTNNSKTSTKNKNNEKDNTTTTANNTDHVVNVNVQDKMGNTALIYAAYYGHNKIVKLLLQRNDIKIYINDKFNTNALQYAIEQKHTQIIKMLLKKGRSTTKRTTTTTSLITIFNMFTSWKKLKNQMINMKDDDDMMTTTITKPKKTMHERILQIFLS